MPHILPTSQNTRAWNGLSQHWGMEVRALMHGGGEEG
jgi:hypothetical protein